MPNNKWKHNILQYDLPVCRNGWLGVYDAIKSAIFKEERYTTVRQFTVSFYSKGDIITNVEAKDVE